MPRKIYRSQAYPRYIERRRVRLGAAAPTRWPIVRDALSIGAVMFVVSVALWLLGGN